MTLRLRSALALVLLLALAGHPLAHPLFKECPCTHAVTTAALERIEPAAVLVSTGCFDLPAVEAIESSERSVRASRAPPAA